MRCYIHWISPYICLISNWRTINCIGIICPTIICAKVICKLQGVHHNRKKILEEHLLEGFPFKNKNVIIKTCLTSVCNSVKVLAFEIFRYSNISNWISGGSLVALFPLQSANIYLLHLFKEPCSKSILTNYYKTVLSTV